MRKKIRDDTAALLEGDIPAVLGLLDDPSGLWQLRSVTGLAGNKATYALRDVERAPEIARYLINADLRDGLDTRMPDRNGLCKALQGTLADGSPKIIVKTDIESFYESIPHALVFRTLRASPTVSALAIEHVVALLAAYREVSGASKGLPRGISASSFLSEHVASALDERLGLREDVLQYFRYVDDIVVVFGPGGSRSRPQDKRHAVINEVTRLGLTVSTVKTQALSFPKAQGAAKQSLEYLGYRFVLDAGKVVVELSGKKIARIIRRVDVSFLAYESGARSGADKSQLVQRVELLTSNYRLSGRKARSYVGLAFSSPLVAANSESVGVLDVYLRSKVDSLAGDPGLVARLEPFTFASGVTSRRFAKVSSKRLTRLAFPWRNLGKA